MTDEARPDAQFPAPTSFEERRKLTVWQRLDDVDRAAGEGHARLRKDLTALEAEVKGVADQQQVLLERVRVLADSPVEATRLMLTSRSIIALVLGVVTIVASVLGASASTKASVHAVEEKVDAQNQRMQDDAKLRDLQMATLRDAAADAKATAADAKRQYELLRYEFQSLKETVISKGK